MQAQDRMAVPHPAHFRFRFDEVRPEPQDIAAVLGYARDARPEPVTAAIDQLLATPDELWSVEGGFVVYPAASVDMAAQRLQVGGESFEVGRIVAGQLSRSDG